MSFHKNIGFIKDEYYFMSDCFFINRSKYISSYFFAFGIWVTASTTSL